MAAVETLIARDDGAVAQREAARIWARAVTVRDRLAVPADTDEKLPGIARSVGHPGASLHLARRGDGAVGFTLLVPAAAALEVLYLAVDPDAWGSGVSGQLLAYVDEVARTGGADALHLWVIDDNHRAVHVYRRAGWVATPEVRTRDEDGRVERRFVRRLAPR